MIRKNLYTFILFIPFLLGASFLIYAQDSTSYQFENSLRVKSVQKFDQKLSLLDTLTSDLIVEINNQSYTVEEIKSLIEFFERITQLHSTIKYPITGLHKIPREDFEKWQLWFNKNCNKLYWDEKNDRVILIPDSSISVIEKKKFEWRYNNYLQALDRGAVSSISTYRRYSIKSISDQNKNEILLYPTSDIIDYDAPVKLLISYFVQFKNYQITEVDVFDIKIFDSGYTIIYEEFNGEERINYFKLDLDGKDLEETIKKQLLARNINIEHGGQKTHDEMKLQVFYHINYESNCTQN